MVDKGWTKVVEVTESLIGLLDGGHRPCLEGGILPSCEPRGRSSNWCPFSPESTWELESLYNFLWSAYNIS